MLPTETTTGFFLRSSITSCQSKSLASGEPPGESRRSTTAFTASSPRRRRSVRPNALAVDAALFEGTPGLHGDGAVCRHHGDVRLARARAARAGQDAHDTGQIQPAALVRAGSEGRFHGRDAGLLQRGFRASLSKPI